MFSVGVVVQGKPSKAMVDSLAVFGVSDMSAMLVEDCTEIEL
jgi:hypothetical protein